MRWEEGLPKLLLRELRYERVGVGDATALPFLAHTLQQTWHRRRGAELTFAGYKGSGGIRTSVAKSAEDIHNAFDADDRNRLRDLLLRMVHLVDDDGRAVRRPSPWWTGRRRRPAGPPGQRTPPHRGRRRGPAVPRLAPARMDACAPGATPTSTPCWSTADSPRPPTPGTRRSARPAACTPAVTLPRPAPVTYDRRSL
ncbi:hypothetical protein [Streptomyces sp. NPDC005890]|uniref:nSTAND1 domain-containing NTPase n=1 Tax=Streptomyces sp. NPDC005890 TaxID=3154568 RepID=UPI0033C8638C